MPSFHKLDPSKVAVFEQPRLGSRARIAQEYDAYVSIFAVGDYGRADLIEGERRTIVRGRLQAAARRRGIVLRFRSGPGVALIFRVDAAPTPKAKPAPQPTQVSRARDFPAQRDAEPSRPPRPRESSMDRYRGMLPRWMRDGHHPGRRGGTKRRA